MTPRQESAIREYFYDELRIMERRIREDVEGRGNWSKAQRENLADDLVDWVKSELQRPQ